jgi:putative SOS response-associated peptidase YedK
MCGRFTLSTPPQTLQEIFDLQETPDIPPRYNIAPSEAIATIRRPQPQAQRELVMLRWGLVPPWAKDPDVGSRMINARSETAATNNAFRSAFRRRRCLIPADGFYEWQKLERRKQPYWIRMRDGLPFAFAGLWEHWEGQPGQILETCTILTTAPSDVVRPIHDRMPVILEPDVWDLWLDPSVQEPDMLQPLLHAYPAEQMLAVPVSNLVNNPANDHPECIAPLASDEPTPSMSAGQGDQPNSL